MKLAVLVGASLLIASSALAQGVAPVLDASRPVTVKFVDARTDEAIDFVGRQAGISIQWDAGVSAETRSHAVAPSTSVRDATVSDVLALLTRQAGLTVVVVDSKTVRIVSAAR
jgi:hypothetical protein